MTVRFPPTASGEVATRPVKLLTMKNLDKLKEIADELAAVQADAKRLAALRDKEILAARNDGWPWEQIERASGLSRVATHDAARRANKGITPVPRQRRG